MRLTSHCIQRRDTLRRLIDLAHSEHPSLKTIAATHIKFFIKDFPDLEDDALNAVYDLCEDTVASVCSAPPSTHTLHINPSLGSYKGLCCHRRRVTGAE